MTRIALASITLACVVSSVRADTLPVVGVPASYTPGTDFSFNISAPGLNGLTDYTLSFGVTAGSPPNLPDLSVSAIASTTNYVFAPDSSNFTVTPTTQPGVNSYFLTISDATSGAGVNTALGVNDNLATITISPGVNLSGPIVIEFTQNDFTTSRDVGFKLPPPIVIPELPSGPAAVPVPPALLLVAIGGLCFAVRNGWSRRNSANRA